MAIHEATKGGSMSKYHKQLGFKSLKPTANFRCPCLFYKIISTGLPFYLFNLIPKSILGNQTRTSQNIRTYPCRTDTFKHFFPMNIATWNKINPETLFPVSYLV